MSSRIFINYRRGQTLVVAQALATLLEGVFGKGHVFIDLHGIDGADNWLHTLDSQVDASDAMVAIIGKDWADARDVKGNRRLDNPNDFVVHEIARAWNHGIPVLPVLVDGAQMPDARELPQSLLVLTLLQAMPLRGESLKLDADQIARRLRVLLSRRRVGGLPMWGVAATGAVLLATGIAGGPWTLTKIGLPLVGLDVVAREQVDSLRSEIVGAQSQLMAANAAVQAAVKKNEAEIRTAIEAAVASERQAADRRSASTAKARDEALQGLANAQAELKAAQEAARTAESRRAKDMAQQKAVVEAQALSERQELERKVREAQAQIDDLQRQAKLAARPSAASKQIKPARGEADARVATIIDSGKLMSTPSWTDKDVAAFVAKGVPASQARDVVTYGQQENWPVGISSLDNWRQNRAAMNDYHTFLLIEYTSGYILHVPAEDNKHMPSQLRPARDIYFYIQKAGVRLN